MIIEANWNLIAKRHPPPHQDYIVRRNNGRKFEYFTACVCYGMHNPWWVVRTMEKEVEPVNFKDSDEWQEI